MDKPGCWIMGVPAGSVAPYWPLVEPWVQRALDRCDPFGDTETLRQLALSRDMQLWLILRGADPIAVVMTEIQDAAKGRVLRVPIVGGAGMADWLPLLHATMRAYARRNECLAMTGHGRVGWIRALKQYGWKEQSVNICCRVEEHDGE